VIKIDFRLKMEEAEALIAALGQAPKPQTHLRKAWDKITTAVQQEKFKEASGRNRVRYGEEHMAQMRNEGGNMVTAEPELPKPSHLKGGL